MKFSRPSEIGFWTCCGSQQGPIKEGLSAFLSLWSSVLLPRHFLGIATLFFNFGMVLETHMKLCETEMDFLGKKICQNLEKWAKNSVF